MLEPIADQVLQQRQHAAGQGVPSTSSVERAQWRAAVTSDMSAVWCSIEADGTGVSESQASRPQLVARTLTTRGSRPTCCAVLLAAAAGLLCYKCTDIWSFQPPDDSQQSGFAPVNAPRIAVQVPPKLVRWGVFTDCAQELGLGELRLFRLDECVVGLAAALFVLVGTIKLGRAHSRAALL